MRILLIAPCISDFYSSPKRMSHLGLISLKNHLDKGHTVKILNLYSPKARKRPLPKEFSYLNPYLRPNTGFFFSGYNSYTKGPGLLIKYLEEFRPDIAGISAFTVCYYRDIAEIADSIKTFDANIPVIVGGTGAMAFPGTFEKISSIDYIIKGNNLNNIKDIIENLHSCKNQRIIDSGTGENWEMACNIGYTRYPLSFVMTRGCPNRCSFCSVYDVSGRRFLKSGLDTFQSALKNMDKKRLWINFEDDNISIDREYFDKLLSILIKHGEKSEISLTFMNGLDFATLDEYLIQRLKKAGLKYLNLTLASASSYSRAMLNRHQSRVQYENIINFAKKYSIDSITYFICGIPGNDISSDMDTLKYLSGKDTLIGFSPFYPVSEKRIPEKYRCLDPVLFRGSAMQPFNEQYTSQKLIEIFRNVCLINSKRPKTLK